MRRCVVSGRSSSWSPGAFGHAPGRVRSRACPGTLQRPGPRNGRSGFLEGPLRPLSPQHQPRPHAAESDVLGSDAPPPVGGTKAESVPARRISRGGCDPGGVVACRCVGRPRKPLLRGKGRVATVGGQAPLPVPPYPPVDVSTSAALAPRRPAFSASTAGGRQTGNRLASCADRRGTSGHEALVPVQCTVSERRLTSSGA
jgi:hypothetical protein